MKQKSPDSKAFLFIIVIFTVVISCRNGKRQLNTIDRFISSLDIDWNAGYCSDSYLAKNYGSRHYTVRFVGSLNNLNCDVYEVYSEMIKFLILYEPTLDTCFEINTISNYPEDAEMYFKNIFYSDDNENFKGLELFLNNCSKTVLNIDSTEIKKLLFYYDDNLFDPENVIDSIGELTTILNDQKLLLQSTDDDLLNCVLAKDVYPFARVKPTFLAVYHVGYRLFYVVGIYFDKPMAFKKGRFKTSIIPVFAKGVN